jgi:hypothetical protein
VNDDVAEARQIIVAAARAMLAGQLSFIEGSRVIHSKIFIGRLETDPDVLVFIGIFSETDALPLGEERINWANDALERLQRDIDRLEEWVRSLATASCENLIRRLG